MAWGILVSAYLATEQVYTVIKVIKRIRLAQIWRKSQWAVVSCPFLFLLSEPMDEFKRPHFDFHWKLYSIVEKKSNNCKGLTSTLDCQLISTLLQTNCDITFHKKHSNSNFNSDFNSNIVILIVTLKQQ